MILYCSMYIQNFQKVFILAINIFIHWFNEVYMTTIRISDETKNKLDSLKSHPRQSYDELLTVLFFRYIKEVDSDGM